MKISLITELFSDCERKVFGRILIKTYDVSRRKFSRQKKSFKKNHVLLGLCRILSRKIGRNVLVRCSKPQFICPEVHGSCKKTASGNLLIFPQIRIWSKPCLKILRQLFDNLEKNAIQVSTGTFWTKNVLFLIKTNFFSFTDFDRCIFEHSKKTILSVLSIRHSTYPQERLDEISFQQRIRIVLPFPNFEWKISSIAARKLRHSCRNCS